MSSYTSQLFSSSRSYLSTSPPNSFTGSQLGGLFSCIKPPIPAKINQIRDVDWTYQRQTRAGIIPYYIQDGMIYFCLAKDTNFKNLTDFGGGVKQTDLDPVHAALREFHQESLAIFGELTIENIQSSFVIFNYDMLIIFHRVEVIDQVALHETFHQRCQALIANNDEVEVNDIQWHDENDFSHMVATAASSLYMRVRSLLDKKMCILLQKLKQLAHTN